MLHNPCIVIIICLVSSFTPLISATLNLPLPSQHPNPEQVVQEVQRRLNVSISRRQLLGVYQKDLTGNPIDDCWKSDPNWQNNRQRLADCGIGFGQAAHGGKGGQTYVVTDSSDINPDNPKQGTLRHAVIQTQPLWIVFSTNMQIELRDKLMVNSFKTIDGRGSNIHVVGRGCVIVDKASNVIIHNIHIHDCVPSYSDGDGITISASRNIWVDHCSLWSCTDGLIDVTEGSTAVTISNSYFSHHDKVMLLGHSDDFVQDTGMQVTVAFNHFGESLVERMPRCRHGYFHVVNNDYTQWGMYAVGGSANPTINSQGNRYVAPSGANAKEEVTKRQDAEEKEWANWNWRSDGDLMVNGAFFVPSGDGDGVKYAMASSVQPQSAQLIDQLTMNAGVLGMSNGGGGGGGGGNSGGWGGTGNGWGGTGGSGWGGTHGSGWGGGGAGASSSGAGTSSGDGAGTGGWEWSDGGAGGGGYDIGSGATPPASVFFSCVVSLLVLYLII